MSGLRAHFLFGANSSGNTSPQQERFLALSPGPVSRINHPLGTGPVGRRNRGGGGGKPHDLRRLETMAVKLDEIRRAAERVAASHGLDVVDLEFAGLAKERVLRVYLEKNAGARERLRAEIAAGGEGLPERLVEGTLSLEQLSGITHEDCAEFSRDFGVLL